MSFGSSLDAKELVRQSVDIVDLVGRYIQLRRQGRHLVGLCPWHDDTRPSLQVNPERQSFKCWVCDIGGDVFSFIMQMEGIAFPEALAMLAEQAGIELRPQTRGGGTAADAAGGGKRFLFQTMAWAEAQYHECLVRLPEGEPGRKYVAERRLSAESVTKFHLGYCPARADWLLRRAQGTPYTAKALEAIGIVGRSSEGRPYDRFRGRLLFSIRDAQDRPVGTGGRLLPDSGVTSPAKYVNSPETPLFTKSKLLYGLDLARHALRKSRTALVMEGYTDVIVAHEHGFAGAVAVLGTALGEEHIRTLRHYVDRILLVLDGDEAGQRRANEVLELFVAQQVDLQIVTLPDGLDPCDFLQEHGAEPFREILETRAVDALEHAFEAQTRGIDLARDVHGASQALERLLAIVAKAPRLRSDTTQEVRFREEKILQRLAASFRIGEADVRRRLTDLRRAAERRPAAPARRDGSADEPAMRAAATPPDAMERMLLELIVRHPHVLSIARGEIGGEQLACPTARRIFETACRLADAGETPTFARLMLEFDDPAIQSLLVEVDEGALAKGTDHPETLLEELIRRFQQRESRRRAPAEAGALRQQRLDEREQLELLRRIVQQERNRHGITEPTDG